MRHSHFTLLGLLCLGVAAISGCGEASDKGTVNGTVTVDSKPLKDGLVTFIPADGKSQTGSATIKDGSFTAELPRTTMKVQFSASKVTGKKKAYDTPDSPVVDIVEEILPPKLNVQSTLQITVKGGVQEEKFDLTTK